MFMGILIVLLIVAIVAEGITKSQFYRVIFKGCKIVSTCVGVILVLSTLISDYYNSFGKISL